MTTLIILQGPPGNDTFSRATEIALHHHALLICPYLIQAELNTGLDVGLVSEEAFFLAHDRVHQALRQDHNVVFNASYSSENEMALWSEVAHRLRAELCIELMQPQRAKIRQPVVKQRGKRDTQGQNLISLGSLWRSARHILRRIRP